VSLKFDVERKNKCQASLEIQPITVELHHLRILKCCYKNFTLKCNFCLEIRALLHVLMS